MTIFPGTGLSLFPVKFSVQLVVNRIEGLAGKGNDKGAGHFEALFLWRLHFMIAMIALSAIIQL